MAFYRRWLFILFALVLSGEQLSAASPKEQSAYAVAVAAFQDEMWSRAETELAQFIQKYPKSTNAPEAVLLQAQAEFKQGKLAEAIALLKDPNHLAKAGTLSDQYIYWIGEAQFQNADLTNAAETFVSLTQNFPDSSLRLRAVIEAATANARLGDWREHDALLENPDGVFQQAAELDPGNGLVVDGRLSLENSKYQQRDFPGVAAVYGLLTNQWPTLNQQQQCQGTYLFYLAKMGLDDFPAALAAATKLVQIAGLPANQEWLATGWASQGAALKQMNRLPEAILAWRNNLTNAPPPLQREAILKIAELQIVQGQLTDAGDALTNFLAQFKETTNSADIALTNVADIALLTAGELHLKDYAAQPAATNQLSAARDCFDQFLREFTNSPLTGKAYLNRGWCEWFANDLTNSLADFAAATQWLPPSEDLAVARFKAGDALFAQKDFTNALENYHAVLDDFASFPAVAGTLGDRALYQILRANLRLTNYDGASKALAQILKQFPASELATNSALLYGEGLVAGQPAAAREQFQNFATQFPDSLLRPQVEFAIARTYELEANWPDAIAGYQGWLKSFPTNDLQPQVDYALAWANFQAGNKTNAFGLFTNFVAHFPASELAPQAQWWVADYFFNEADYVDAERNYELFYQNFPTNDYAGQARLMAGRAAVGRQDYNGAINNYFSKLEEDTNCLVDLRVQAAFAHGSALMRMDSTDTNNPLANFQPAIKVFGQIAGWDPTNQLVAPATLEMGNCNLQLTNYDVATNDYAQVVGSTNASVSARSQAQIGIGIALEKKAELATGTNQTALLELALNNYVDVLHEKNLRDHETADLIWVKKAGLQAAALAGTLGEWESAVDIYVRLKTLLPQLGSSLDKKITEANSHLPPGIN
jgi:TolA-binding protein